jgi:hypothetical protein
MNLTLRQKVNGEGGLAKGDLRVFYTEARNPKSINPKQY